MTATPIPRTLTLTLYGDLDLSVLDELPPGRRPVRTFLRDDSARGAVHDFIRDQVGRGRQVYIVSPRLEETDRSRLQAARSLVRQLQEGPFRDLPVALLHGRMPAEEKDRIMVEFAAGRIGVLVATTVVEVGIDVPGATVMMIENAERFGLSQLHQLRGRVGRGKHPGVCVLMIGKEAAEDSRRRLRVLAESTDGFAISEADLEIRGPGELLGDRQAGVPDIWWTRLLRNRDLLETARDAATAAVFGDDQESPAARGLHRYVEERWQRRFGRIQVG
jgi:ATP-dependent DNA helicase RecG